MSSVPLCPRDTDMMCSGLYHAVLAEWTRLQSSRTYTCTSRLCSTVTLTTTLLLQLAEWTRLQSSRTYTRTSRLCSTVTLTTTLLLQLAEWTRLQSSRTYTRTSRLCSTVTLTTTLSLQLFYFSFNHHWLPATSSYKAMTAIEYAHYAVIIISMNK